MARKLTPKKAKQILREDRARGRELTPRQRRFFGLIAGGGRPTRLRNNPGKEVTAAERSNLKAHPFWKRFSIS